MVLYNGSFKLLVGYNIKNLKGFGEKWFNNFTETLLFLIFIVGNREEKRKKAFLYAGVAKYCTSEKKGAGQDAEPGSYNTEQM